MYVKTLFFPLVLWLFFGANLSYAKEHKLNDENNLFLVGGFKGPSRGVIINNVSDALHADDDSLVELTGHLTSFVGGDDYIFQDMTGEIKVEIDDYLWNGFNVTPDNKVLIHGEVDRDFGEVTIDTRSIEVVQ